MTILFLLSIQTFKFICQIFTLSYYRYRATVAETLSRLKSPFRSSSKSPTQSDPSQVMSNNSNQSASNHHQKATTTNNQSDEGNEEGSEDEETSQSFFSSASGCGDSVTVSENNSKTEQFNDKILVTANSEANPPDIWSEKNIITTSERMDKYFVNLTDAEELESWKKLIDKVSAVYYIH